METHELRTLGRGDRVRICWGFFWRAVLTTVASSACGFLAGGVVGFLLALMGLPPEYLGVAQVMGGLAGVVVAFCFLWIYVHWLFSARIGKYRLRLVDASE